MFSVIVISSALFGPHCTCSHFEMTDVKGCKQCVNKLFMKKMIIKFYSVNGGAAVDQTVDQQFSHKALCTNLRLIVWCMYNCKCEILIIYLSSTR